MVRDLLIDGSGKHHKESEKYIKIVGLIKSFVDFSQKLAEYVCASLLIELFIVVIFWLLLLRVKVDIDIVEIALHIDFFQSTIVLPFLELCYEIAQSVDAVSSNVFCIAIAVIYLFLNNIEFTCLGLPRRLAYSDRGFITCPGAYIYEQILSHCA